MFIYTCSRSVSCLSSLPENATPIPWLRQRLPVEQLIPPWLEARPRSHPSKGQLNPLFYRWLQRHQTLPEVDKKKGSSALEKAVSSATSYCACFPIMWRYDMVIKICLVLVFFMHITWVILEQSCLPMTDDNDTHAMCINMYWHHIRTPLGLIINAECILLCLSLNWTTLNSPCVFISPMWQLSGGRHPSVRYWTWCGAMWLLWLLHNVAPVQS